MKFDKEKFYEELSSGMFVVFAFMIATYIVGCVSAIVIPVGMLTYNTNFNSLWFLWNIIQLPWIIWILWELIISFKDFFKLLKECIILKNGDKE